MGGLSLRRAVLRVMLSLPTPVLRAFSGGAAIYRGGRTLDPRLQFLSAVSRRPTRADDDAPQDARRVMADDLAAVAGRPEPDVRAEALTLEGPRGPLHARVHRPKDQDPAAAILVFAHAGGLVGDLESSHVFCTLLAGIMRRPVLVVDYAMAPEHRFPAGLDDVAFAYRWARDNARLFDAPDGVAAIAGVSMGAGLAAAVAQDLKRAGEPQPALQLLVHPCVDLAGETQSMALYGEAFPLSRGLFDRFVDQYLGSRATPADPRLSPLREPDLSGLAPAVVATAGFDPLRDQGEAYARALRDAGVPVIYRCHDSLAHGFTAFTGAVPAADAACREIAALARGSLEARAS